MSQKSSDHLKDGKLIKMIAVFSNLEQKQFREFVNAPFFNKNQNLIILYDYIQSYSPNFEHHDLTFNNAFQYLFPKKVYKKSVIVKLNSKLLKLAEQFINYQVTSNDAAQTNLNLLRFYNRRKLSNFFNYRYKKSIKQINNQVYRNADHLKHLFEYEYERSNFLGIRAEDGTGDILFQQTADSLDTFYICKKLEQLCQMKNRQRSVNYVYDFTLMTELLQFVPNSIYYQIPTISIWYHALILLNEPTKAKNYYKLRELLEKHSKLFTIAENNVLYTYLYNALRSSHPINGNYYKELFQLYEIQLKNKIIYVNGYLHPIIFRNIVSVGLKLEKNAWVKSFLEEHQHKITPEYEEREDMYSLCYAMWCFAEQRYEETLDELNQLKYDNINTKMEERRIRLKVYYELEYFDLLDDLVNSFRKFLTKNKSKINEFHVEANRHFVNVLFAIAYTRKGDKERIEKITAKLQEITVLPEKDWLLQKIKKLK